MASGWCQTSSPKKILGGIQVSCPSEEFQFPVRLDDFCSRALMVDLVDHGDFHRQTDLYPMGSPRGVSHLHGRGRSECFRRQRCREVLFQPAGIEPFPGDLPETWGGLNWSWWKHDWSLLASFGISKQRWARFFPLKLLDGGQ